MASRSRDPNLTARPNATAPRPAAIGNWQPTELLGEGRWCRVYRARPAGSGDGRPADYALKVAKRSEMADPLAVRLLQREALLARRVSHPHLTSVLSARIHRPPYYLVMPYLEGHCLEAMLAQAARLTVKQATSIALQTAEAIWALHCAGWVHSDVKPGNIFVSATGHATLLDLGLARQLTPIGDVVPFSVAGTLPYTAPESFGSRMELSSAADVYSLGVTLYRMVTGALPFPQSDPAAIAAAHLHQAPPDPRLFHPRLDDPIVHLLDRMLDKHPRRRLPLAELLGCLAELTELPDTHDAAETRIKPAARRTAA